MSNLGVLVEQPLVVEPCDLDSPFVLLSGDSGEQIVLLVLPMELSYGSIHLAILAKGKNTCDKGELPRFVDHMRQVIKESRETTIVPPNNKTLDTWQSQPHHWEESK